MSQTESSRVETSHFDSPRQLTIRLPAGLYEDLELAATAEHRSLNAEVVVRLLKTSNGNGRPVEPRSSDHPLPAAVTDARELEAAAIRRGREVTPDPKGGRR